MLFYLATTQVVEKCKEKVPGEFHAHFCFSIILRFPEKFVK